MWHHVLWSKTRAVTRVMSRVMSRAKAKTRAVTRASAKTRAVTRVIITRAFLSGYIRHGGSSEFQVL